jgi:dihydroxyacetone kinase-like protein
MLTLAQWQKMFTEADRELVNQSKYFCELDSKIGDGDHGVTIARMAEAMQAYIKDHQPQDVKSFLDDLGMICMNSNGGSAGPLWGTILCGLAGGAPEGKTEIDGPELKAMFKQCASDFKDISKAKVGDKTLVDALYPAIEAALAAGDDTAAIMEAAAQAAVKGADQTVNFAARFGRARNFGEASKGSKDPGAVSLSVLLRSLAKAAH